MSAETANEGIGVASAAVQLQDKMFENHVVVQKQDVRLSDQRCQDHGKRAGAVTCRNQYFNTGTIIVHRHTACVRRPSRCGFRAGSLYIL